MPEGGCLCGKCRISYTGEPALKVSSVDLSVLILPSAHTLPSLSLTNYLYLTYGLFLLTTSQLLCHCTDCKKITGSTYSTNAAVSDDTFKVLSGNLKTFTKTADGGNPITSHFCPDCGSTLWREGTSFPGMKIVKAGVLDGDALKDVKPQGELYAPERTQWVKEIEGANQAKGMS